MATSTDEIPVNGLPNNLKVLLNAYLETSEQTGWQVFQNQHGQGWEARSNFTSLSGICLFFAF